MEHEDAQKSSYFDVLSRPFTESPIEERAELITVESSGVIDVKQQ
jgi:hypothetical protein